jgi:hypothetical protein
MELALAKIWAFLKLALPALVGAVMAVYFALIRKDPPPVTPKEAVFLLIFSWFIGYWVGLGFAQYFNMNSESPIVFLAQWFSAVIGMGVTHEFNAQVPSLVKSASSSIKAWFSKKTGG